ncbi:uncharacterized protein BJ171DRAFT_488057 [Polychytrium aggregatum]|uniref:uncharacterized protein n=1 Tax=Polychytrium aggregatum TaxID=110093 RepID=UPI0022FE79F9|nr:uncharacterized protein BJ171DRAFT_488057 [Polychytrium aggregatum]KAI9208991.1 hypothetical protein BJ171DRAFT_488057 [Polychytrium aggregatum]
MAVLAFSARTARLLVVVSICPHPRSNMADVSAKPKQTPNDFLSNVFGRPVIVKLNSGVEYRGVLSCLDGYMNIALEQTEEFVNGQRKNAYGDAFIRGNNVLYISLQKE